MKLNFTNCFAALAAAAALTLGTATLHAEDVRTDYDRGYDFSHIHTFSIYRVHSYDQIEEGRLRSDIEASLAKRGWQEVPQGGDIAVSAIGNVHDVREYNTFYDGFGGGYGYRRFGFGGGGFAETRGFNIPVGTLAIDLYDANSHQLVFRGTTSDQLSNNSDKNVKKDVKAVDKIFNKVPAHRVG